MAISIRKEVGVKDAADILLNFSIDRNDLEILLNGLPPSADIDRVVIEYEIQILKILSVGWSLSFFLEGASTKSALTESFWAAVQEFSRNLSIASSVSLNRDFDYFAILKERLDTYLKALNGHPETRDPAVLIGPAFAAVCGDGADAIAILCGSKMFHVAVSGVRHYLESVTLIS